MTDPRRAQRALRPTVDMLEGRVVLNAGTAAGAHMASVRQLRVQEIRHLRHEQRIERAEARAHRASLRAASLHARAVFGAPAVSTSALSIVEGTPAATTTTTTGTGAAVTRPSLIVHS